MIATLVAALSLASSAIDVPYLPQTDALCGGAAVAMVFRYWGDSHADVQQFATLVDERRTGIATDALVDAVTQRGWRAVRLSGSIDGLREQLKGGRPVIVLIEDRSSRYHFVVVTGADDHHVIVHDPAWGPSRRIPIGRMLRAWAPTGFWSLII